MRLHCKQEKDGGKLTIPIPIFLANPSHHIKCMFKLIFELVSPTLVKYPERCKGIDETCIKKYTSCIVSKNRNLPIDQFLSKEKGPLEYMFKRHQWCNTEWCWAKDLEDATPLQTYSLSVQIWLNLLLPMKFDFYDTCINKMEHSLANDKDYFIKYFH